MPTWTCEPFAQLTASRVYELMVLRQRVFVVEQACAYLDADGLDDRCHHLVGTHRGDLVAYLRIVPPGALYPEASLGRVLVTAGARGQGLGRALVAEGVRWVRTLHPGAAIRIGAQAHLEAMYAALGFVAFGEIYQEDGIPHVAMRLP